MIFKKIEFVKPSSVQNSDTAWYKVEFFGSDRESDALLTKNDVKLSNALVRIKDKISEEELNSLIEAIEYIKEDSYSEGYDDGESEYGIWQF